MCGIFGVWSKKPLNKDNSLKIIKNVWENLNDRGPDGHSSFYWNNLHNSSMFNSNDTELNFDPSIILIHNRLSIIDLSINGTQPMCDSTRRFWITYNGEIYNYLEIKHDLELSGIRFKSKSDTEVLLEGWVKWGPEILNRLNGMFAFSIFDSLTNELYIIRDRIGIKPLYYFFDSNFNIVFSSDQSTLIYSGIVKAEPNWEGVVSSMQFQTAIRPQTVYKNIFAVKPGNYIKITENTFKNYEYWDLDNSQNDKFSESESIERYKYLLEKAIKNCLISDVEVASLMSGGIDSSTMSILSSLQNPNLKTYTLSWDDNISKNSELDQAIYIANKYHINHHVCKLNSKDISNNIVSIKTLNN